MMLNKAKKRDFALSKIIPMHFKSENLKNYVVGEKNIVSENIHSGKKCKIQLIPANKIFL